MRYAHFFKSNISYYYSYYFQIMGQCMEETADRFKMHPHLGPLQLQTVQKRQYFKLCLALANEEDYVEWSKKINKLRYSPELKDYLYIPVREEFRTGTTSCQGSGYLQLLFEPYEESLEELLASNIKSKRYVSQQFLGCVLLLLSRYINYHHKKASRCRLQLENIVTMADAKMKIIPEEIVNTAVLRPGYEIQIDEDQHIADTQNSLGKEEDDPIYVAGLICLCFAGLIESKNFYSQETKRWRLITQAQRNKNISNIEMRYSPIVAELLRSMLPLEPTARMGVQELTLKLEELECDLVAKRQLESMIGLGVTMGTPLRTSNVYETKLNNNSNLLKISALKFDPTDKASTNMQLYDEELEQSQNLSIL